MAAVTLRPAEICRWLLAATDASEGRRRRRKRNTTPDAIGIDLKRQILEAVIQADPAPEAFESFLLERSLIGGGGLAPPPDGGASGPVRAMAMDILSEWRLALGSPSFRHWLQEGAPSADR